MLKNVSMRMLYVFYEGCVLNQLQFQIDSATYQAMADKMADTEFYQSNVLLLSCVNY